MYIPILYGTAVDLYAPLIEAEAQDFTGSITLVSGDATISLDGAAESTLDTLPTEAQSGEKRFTVPISSAEATCKIGKVNIIDQTATKVFEDQAIYFYTYGHASAHMPFLPVNVDLAPRRQQYCRKSVEDGAL